MSDPVQAQVLPIYPKHVQILVDPVKRALLRVYLLSSVPPIATVRYTFPDERFPDGGQPLPADVRVTTKGETAVLQATVSVPVGVNPPPQALGFYVAYLGDDYREALTYRKFANPVPIGFDTEKVQVNFELKGN